jgi:hypothetical protein
MESLTSFAVGSKCSVIVELVDGTFVRRNGVVKNEVRHEQGAWCIELEQSPYFVKRYEKYFEISEPMTSYEELINAFDELAN